MEALADRIGEFRQRCVDELGFIEPLCMVVVSVNGSVLGVRPGETPVVLCEHAEGRQFVLPINIMITDGRGEATRMLIGSDGQLQLMN